MKENGTSETYHLLKRWGDGDQAAFNALVERYVPWIRERVRLKLGALLKKKGDVDDYVQDVVLRFLRDGPRLVISDVHRFRALLYKIVQNTLYDKYDWFTARRRDILREKPGLSDTILNMDPPRDMVETPSKIAQRNENEAWVILGLDLMHDSDREIVRMRHFDQAAHTVIAQRFEISPAAARKRYERAIERLEKIIFDLRRGELGSAMELNG